MTLVVVEASDSLIYKDEQLQVIGIFVITSACNETSNAENKFLCSITLFLAMLDN